MKRRQFIQYSSLALASGLIAGCENRAPRTSPSDRERIVYGTNWYAQAEHGGFYQAVATGIYEEYGLDVTIQMGGPQVNLSQLLMGGVLDFTMGGSMGSMQAVYEGVPKVTVAAMFQKDPQILLAHPNTGVETLADLRGRPIYVSSISNSTYWPMLRKEFGFTDDQRRPYNFSVAPFLADTNSAQQGYLSSEPWTVEQQGGFTPVVFLLSDYGYTPYAMTIDTRRRLVEENPDLVQRFVDASIKGWYSYLEDPAPGNELIQQDNPEMSSELLAYGLEKIKEYGLATSGDAEKYGIGIMTAERWEAIFQAMLDAGTVSPDFDYTQGFTLQFVGQSLESRTL
ncbi:ABC transporter substrate-binding protein [Spirulina subsalsa]|uniref:ABC transporter substrate-binding protein n=1 Tax=Spirulina subsalsa TaxID=54311 RepID=UPI0003165518|nr:ABC transporter substrate-binding protein [Spirulina subsalsa]